jgi:hypothetical protein
MALESWFSVTVYTKQYFDLSQLTARVTAEIHSSRFI